MSRIRLACSCLVLTIVTGCGGGGAASRDGGDNPDGAAVTCPAPAEGEKRKLGACCTADAHCSSGLCWNGFCTKTCTGDEDCTRVAAPSPFPSGTEMHCAANQTGETWNICLPGSGKVCSDDPSSCSAGESCVLAVNPLAPSSGELAGVCLAKIAAGDHQATGSRCDQAKGPYQCEDQGGILGDACWKRTCTRVCREDRDCPGAMLCATPLVFPGKANVMNGAGLCVGMICGEVGKPRNPELEPMWRMGADSVCVNDGEVCAPSVFRSSISGGARQMTLLLTCMPPADNGGAFGQACSTDPAAGKPCKDSSLCLADSGGAFCSISCRTDRDCSSGAYCLERPGPKLPNGDDSWVGWCVPRERIAGKACATERDCADNEGCLPVGRRSMLTVCSSSGVGTAPLGASCTSPEQCRSTECRDSEWRTAGASGIRAVCTGRCLKNSDCAAGQVCEPHVFSANGTPEDPQDDLVQGVCRPLLASAAGNACDSPDWCVAHNSGDSCDTSTGRCFTAGRAIGAACSEDIACGLTQTCELSSPFTGGACLAYGCSPTATTGVDACPAGSVCQQRFSDAPLYRCYEACSTTGPNTCSRAAQGYSCNGGICMVWGPNH